MIHLTGNSWEKNNGSESVRKKKQKVIESTLPYDNIIFHTRDFHMGSHLGFINFFFTALHCAPCSFGIYRFHTYISLYPSTEQSLSVRTLDGFETCVFNTHQIPYDVTESFSICLRFYSIIFYLFHFNSVFHLMTADKKKCW